MWLFQTVWNWLPWWSFVLIALVLVAIFWQPIMTIWTILPRPVKAGLIFLGSIVVAVQYGRNRGQQSERARNAAADERVEKKKGEINAHVDNMSDDAVDSKLRNNGWMRD